MTDTTDTELERLDALIDEFEERVRAATDIRDVKNLIPFTRFANDARAALRSYFFERTLDTRRLDWLEQRYAEGEGFRVTVFEQMSLGARGVIDQRMASKKESPDDR